MYYDRKIRYLDYHEGGVRIRGGGHVKLEVRDGRLWMELAVAGLHTTDSFVRDVVFRTEKREKAICKIEISGGRGICRQQWERPEDIGGSGIAYGDLRGIRVALGPDREVSCSWSGEGLAAGRVESPGDVRPEDGQSEIAAQERDRELEPARQPEACQSPVRLQESKWAQLWAIYPHIRPFDDGREYISIGPADFVIFPEESYRTVNNSFLLHGFYNYHHLLLARVEKKGECLYYIGVPGNFFEKEKQVAILFGFESFECAEEPAQAGDFGYYMMRTGL